MGARTAGTRHPALSFDHYVKETVLSYRTEAMELREYLGTIAAQLVNELTPIPCSSQLPSLRYLEVSGSGRTTAVSTNRNEFFVTSSSAYRRLQPTPR